MKLKINSLHRGAANVRTTCDATKTWLCIEPKISDMGEHFLKKLKKTSQKKLKKTLKKLTFPRTITFCIKKLRVNASTGKFTNYPLIPLKPQSQDLEVSFREMSNRFKNCRKNQNFHYSEGIILCIKNKRKSAHGEEPFKSVFFFS